MATPPNKQNPPGPSPIPPDHQLAKTSDAPKPVQPLDGGRPAHDDHDAMPKDLKAPGGGMIAFVASVFAVLLIVIFFVGWYPSHKEEEKTRDDAIKEQQRKPVAQWAHPTPDDGASDVNLPCDVEANQSTALFTRANGFLAALHGPGETKINDIGTVVKKGQILALISTPDVDAQVHQAEAAVGVAEANIAGAQAARDAANQTYGFNVSAQQERPGSVSKEALVTAKSALEQADATLKQTNANLESAKANLVYQKSIQSFENVVAPFDGVITYRKYDVGQYLSPTQSSAGQEVFDVQQTDTLRAFVNVPQGYANNVSIGQKAKLAIRNFPGVDFYGTVARTAGAVDPNTRTLKVQINIDNRDGRLFAGEYCELQLPVSAQRPVLRIPSSGLIFNDKGLTVGTIDADNKIHIKAVKVGRDFGTELEILDGLDASDRVVLNPGERFAEGTVVDPHEQPMVVKPKVAPPPMSPVTTQPMGATTEPMTIAPQPAATAMPQVAARPTTAPAT
jgi:RND family efflux transporter MFP subunit